MTKNSCPKKYQSILDKKIKIYDGKGYHKILEEIKMETGKTIQTCWIADRKRILGYPMGKAWNSGKSY